MVENLALFSVWSRQFHEFMKSDFSTLLPNPQIKMMKLTLH